MKFKLIEDFVSEISDCEYYLDFGGFQLLNIKSNIYINLNQESFKLFSIFIKCVRDVNLKRDIIYISNIFLRLFIFRV